jgi:hypothetical protein
MYVMLNTGTGPAGQDPTYQPVYSATLSRRCAGRLVSNPWLGPGAINRTGPNGPIYDDVPRWALPELKAYIAAVSRAAVAPGNLFRMAMLDMETVPLEDNWISEAGQPVMNKYGVARLDHFAGWSTPGEAGRNKCRNAWKFMRYILSAIRSVAGEMSARISVYAGLPMWTGIALEYFESLGNQETREDLQANQDVALAEEACNLLNLVDEICLDVYFEAASTTKDPDYVARNLAQWNRNFDHKLRLAQRQGLTSAGLVVYPELYLFYDQKQPDGSYKSAYIGDELALGMFKGCADRGFGRVSLFGLPEEAEDVLMKAVKF